MANVPFEEYYNEVALECEGVPDLMIDRALVYAARTFCQDSQFWRVTLGPAAVVSGVSTLPLPAESEIVRPVWASLGEKPLMLVCDYELQETFSAPPEGVVIQNDQAVLAPKTDAVITDELTVHAVLAPTRQATSIPEAIGNEYFEAMLSGAISYLALMKNRAWSDADTASLHNGVFSRHIHRARRMAGDGGANVKRVVAYGGL